MSGQYPPPNPFSRAPLHQRPPPSQTLMPWGHSQQPTGRQWFPSRSMVGSSMNFYGSPHMGLPSRAAQPWVPPQTHPKPPETRTPLFGLLNQRIPSDYNQEETMDLSSHSSAAQDNSKMTSARPENNDVLRNGTILPPEVNGDVDRTEPEAKNSIVTSVIAPNPLREGNTDVLNCSKVTDTPVLPLLVKDLDPPVCVKGESSGVDIDISESSNSVASAVLKTSPSIVESVVEDESTSDRLSKAPERNANTNTDEENVESLSAITESVSALGEETASAVDSGGPPSDQFQSSYLEGSSLSVDDTDDSKLVVAESSADDIFGMSPSNEPVVSTVNVPLASVSSQETKLVESHQEPAITETVPDKTAETASLHSTNALPVEDSEPHPSVENVEILLESMFNSQEETSCSSLTSNSGVPQSVIVSNGMRTPAEVIRPQMEIITPMKEEELAMTLAEDNPIETEVKLEKKEEKVNSDFMDEIEKKLEMLTESNVCEPKLDNESKVESPTSECIKEEPVNKKNIEEESVDTLLSNEREPLEEKSSIPPLSIESEPKIEASSSNNPFIEVETQLEKMFAGIVEPTDEIGSDHPSQPSVSEPKKPAVNRRSITKRKKGNSRRPSDNSLFGGSSCDSTPVKKKGRKRPNDSGSEKGSKKIKTDSGESLRKGKIPKDVANDSLNKVKGPFVHIEGSKESPASVVVVNSGVRADDEDGLDKAIARRKHSTLQRSEASRKGGSAYSSSTLSSRYNSDTADLSWVCVFCKRGPHCVGGLGGEPAGDLFGPYRIPATPPGDDTFLPGTPADRDVVEEQKKRGGKHAKSLRASGVAEHFIQKMSKKSKRSVSVDSLDAQPGLLSVDGGYEVWLHGHCAQWAPGLCIIGSQLVGLDDAVWTALRTKCTQCGEMGAGIGCVIHNCAARMHYHCAALCGWLLDTDSFIARCHVHRTRLRPS